jgi:Ca2+-binding RTX toxin-like protein
MTGGADNDILNGEAGDDLYHYNMGDGNDTIADSSGNDTLQLGEGFDAGTIDCQIDGSGVISDLLMPREQFRLMG